MPEKSKKIAGAGAVLKFYFEPLKKHPIQVVFLAIGAFGAPVIDLITPLYLRQLFNTLASGAPTPETIQALSHSILFFSLFSILGWALFRMMVFILTDAESRTMQELTESAFSYLIRHSYEFFSSNFAGSLTHRVNKFARSFERVIDTILMCLIPAFVFTGGAVGVLYVNNHTLGIVLGIWAVGIILFQLWVMKLRRPLRNARAAEESHLTGVIADSMGNHLTTVLFAGSMHEDKRVGDVARVWQKLTARYWRQEEFIWAALGLLMIGVNVALLWGAMVFWQKGELTVGDFVLIQTYLIGTFHRLLSMNRDLRAFNDAFADAGEMAAILLTPHEIVDASHAKKLVVTKGEIAFSDINFHFNKDAVVLRDLNLTIPGGQRVALVGPSGAGKSTITKLLLRLYDLKKGSIAIDGQDIAKITQDSLHDSIAFVPQEPVLFHRSLMDNIRYGKRDASDEEVFEAARQAHCDEFISKLPLGYDTFVGERGVKLSGGERQRVAIARALLKNAPILLLDEATSSLDSESEALIQDALKVLMQGKTVIVIAHRLSTIMNMDRIVVIEGGSIVADGTHDELLQHGGLYKKLWSIQAGGFIKDEDE